MSVYAKVNIEIIRATSLLGMNIGGLSNPFVKVEIGAKNYTTPTIDNTTEPNWRERGLSGQCTFQFPAVHIPTVVTISVYNKLPYGDQLSDFIGQASVTVMKPGQNQQMIPLTHGGNMQLANRAPTGCGMIEVSYDALEVSESEYFDALLGKTSTVQQQQQAAAPVPAPAPIEQQQQQQVAAPTASTTLSNGASTLSSTANSTPLDSTLQPPPSQQQQQNSEQQQQDYNIPSNNNNNNVNTAAATPDVSMVVQQQSQPTLPQQHQIPSLGSFSNQNNNLPPRAPISLAHSNSGVMPTFESSSNNNNNNYQQQGSFSSSSIQVQAPSQGNAFPMPEPQAHYAYVPQIGTSTNVINTTTSNNNSSRVGSSALPPPSSGGAGRRSSSAGRKDPCSSTMSSARNNNNQSGLMNKSSAHTNTIMNNNNNNISSMTTCNSTTNKPKSERLSVSASRWFDLIRSGNPASSGTALREIRAASEKDPSIILEACDASGRTLIHEAAWSGSIELFQELLALAIRAGNTRPTAMSMQLWASEQHNIAAWTTIPNEGYQGPRYVTANAGNTVLHTAATAGRTDLVDWMLRQGAVFVAMAQTRNKRGLRPLESAAERGHLDTAQVLARSTTA